MRNDDNHGLGILIALILIAVFLAGMGAGSSFQRAKACTAQCPKAEATKWDDEHQRCQCLGEVGK